MAEGLAIIVHSMLRRLSYLIVACLAALPAAAAPDRPTIERQFQAWLVSDLWSEAKAAKVSRATFDSALAGVTLDWTMPDLHPPGEKVVAPKIEWQREFGSPGSYFGEKNLTALASGGRERLARWKKTLAAIESRHGVPAEILVSIWGKESGFGAATMPKPAIRALATSAFMGRRAAFFRKELVAALVIVENGDIGAGAMRSSVGGALGQPQFMPSVFLHYAVDFDRDGKRDIWSSVPDSLASIAHFLEGEGWVKGRGWGMEVTVPASVSCALEGPEQGLPVADWAKRGVTRMNGKPLPADTGLSYLLMPAGRHGPAFLVTDNFYVLKHYNNSESATSPTASLARPRSRMNGGRSRASTAVR
jgi:lytic murein transglycosylase